MKLFKTDSPLELAIQEIEAVMQKHGISVSWEYGFRVTSRAMGEGKIVDIDNPRDFPSSFPRQLESERIALDE